MLKNPVLRIIIGAVALIAGFVIVQRFLHQARAHDAKVDANRAIEQALSNGVKNRPDLPVPAAQRQGLADQMSADLNAEQDPAKRARMAAEMFWGFYYLNTRARYDYCKEKGVDIVKFTRAFSGAHIDALNKARAIYAKAGANEYKLYDDMQRELKRMVVADQMQLANMNGQSVEESCEWTAKNADKLVDALDFTKMQPEVYKVLAAGG